MDSLLSSFAATAANGSTVDPDDVNRTGDFTEEPPAVINSENDLSLYALEINLTRHQRSKLIGVSQEGIKCYLQHWLQSFKRPMKGNFCDAAWDEIYCWPPTQAGENASQSCSEVMKHDPEVLRPDKVLGRAFRFCGENGTWEWNGWTNYSQCLAGLDDAKVSTAESDLSLVNTVRYIFFLGSILSIACILLSLLVFYYFKSLRCDRITVQVHLMLSLLLRCVLLVIITEPFVLQRAIHYRIVGWICKTVMAFQLYATVSSVGWMFVQGHFLNAKVTTNVFDCEAPLRAYFGIGWGIPLLLVLFWVWAMEVHHEAYCWKNYSKSAYIWIILGPMIFALMINLIFLLNIMRILLTRIPQASATSDCLQFRRALKATVVLFPLLGVNNLLFMYNPGGEFEAAYMITNAVVQASQGSVAATLYCFLNDDVWGAIRREYRRRSVRRSVLIQTPSSGILAVVVTPIVYSSERCGLGERPASCNARSNSVCICEPISKVAHEHNINRKGYLLGKVTGSQESPGRVRKATFNSVCSSSDGIPLKTNVSAAVGDGRTSSGLMRTTSV